MHRPVRLASREEGIVQRGRNIDANAAERVDDVAEGLEVHADPVIDGLTGDL